MGGWVGGWVGRRKTNLNVNAFISSDQGNESGVGGVAVGAPLVPVSQALGGLAW